MRHHNNRSSLSRARKLAIVTFVWLVAAVGLVASAQATTYTVGTVNDSATGACPEPKAGTCSLRQLIEFEDALAVTPKPADTIIVPAGKYGLAKGELLITQSLGIQGAGARKTFLSQSRGAEQRVFKIEPPKSEKVPTVTISGLEISGGTAGEKNGSFGGDVYNAGELVLLEDWITGGTASSGGGISNNTGTLVVRRSLVSSNHASTGGGDSGGIQNHGSAVCNAACFPGKKAVLTIEDSTVADNDARLGAGVFSWSDAADGNEVTVTRSTIADNSTEEESSGGARGLGGGLLISDGKADVAGSIVAFNNATINEEFFQSNCSKGENGSIVSLGYNLETETDCGFESKGDLQQEFSRFNFAGELQDNGGNTDTLAPAATSAAVDAIPTKESLCGGGDQRDTTRPQGTACDMGAVELVPFTIHATAGTSFSGVVAESPPCGVFREPEPTIDWGDGKTSAGSTTEEDITGTHTYGKAGTYNGSVTYNNDCGQGTHVVPFQAQVVGPPVISEAKAGAATETTGKAEFTLAPAGSETTYEVEYGLDTKYGSKTTAAKLAGGAGPTHEVVTISGLKPNTTYHFRVVATNAQAPGGVRSGDLTLATVGPPVLSEVKTGAVTETTGKAEFTLDPAGSETTYEVEYGLDTKYGSKTTAAKLAGGAGPTHEVVTISGLKPNTTYHFRVVATNAQAPGGVRSGDLSFATVGPPVLSAVKAGAVTETTGKVEFTLDPAGSETTYEVEYGLDTKYGSKTTAAKLAGGAGPTPEVVTISGLKANTTYHFRVVATNAQAPGGVRSSDLTFTTVGPPVLSEVRAGATTETTGKVEFTVDPAGSETTYEVEYGLDTKYGSKTAAVKLSGGAGPTPEVVTISGLKPNTTYHFRVVATNAQAPGGVRSGDLTFATVASPVLSGVKAGAVTETTGRVEFTLDPAGSETTYEVEYGLDTKYGSKTTAAKLAGGAGPTPEVVTISGLKANTTYHFRVVATNAQAPGGVRSADATFATVGPPLLSEVKAGAVTETTGKVEFTLDPAGLETTYEVEYGLDTKYGSKTTAAKLAAGAGPTHEVVTIPGLKANTTYHFRVVATNAQAPAGVRSADLSFATVGSPALSEVKAGAVTETTGKVEFTLDPAGSETTYEVEYGLDTKYGSKTTAAKLAGGAGPTPEVVTISGLKPNTTYHFRVVATNAQAPGGVRSGDLTFATVGPPVLSEVRPGATTETTAKVELTVDPAGSETTFEVEYGLDTKYGSKTAAVKLSGGAGPTPEVVAISGLKPNNTYHFRVVATNAQAPGGVRSGDLTFATVASPVLSGVKAGAVTETTGKVEFTVDPAGSEATVEVEYGLDTKYGSKTSPLKVAGNAGPTPEVVTVSGLKANTTYHFRVVATNAQAPGGVRSTDLTFATVGPPVLSAVEAGAVTETTGKVEFTLDPAGSETTYEIEYGLDTKYGSKTAPAKLTAGAGPTSELVTISGLKPNTTYHFRVVAMNAQAPGGVRSGDLTLATVGPPVITEAKAGAVTETTGKVEFTVDPAHLETTYEVEYGLDTKYGSKTTAAKLAAGAGPTHEVVTISGLKANTSYHFRVVATNAQAPGGVRSGDATFATVGPPVVSEVDVVVVTETTVEVAFTVDPAGEETTYEVDYGPDASYGQRTSPVKLAGGAGPTHEVVTISGLTPGSTYHFAIVATNKQAAGGVKAPDQPVTTAAPAGGGGAGGGGGGGVLTNPGGGVLGTQTTGPATLDTLPPPVLGKTFNVEPVSGKVFISLPPGAHLTRAGFSLGARESLSKGLHFIPLTEARQIPVGSTLETTAGVARIETATVGKPQIGDFGAGIFKLLQQRKQRGLTELNIVNNVAPKKVCATLGKGAASAAKLSSKVLGRIHGSAHGRFVTKGQYSAATVRGTIWSVQNQCNGTLTKVTRDVVTVRDFRRRKTITLLSGQSYLARAPGRRSR